MSPSGALCVPDDAEEVDIAIVDGEVEEHRSGASIQPQVGLQLLQLSVWLVSGAGQILIETSSSVCGHFTRVAAFSKAALLRVNPPDTHTQGIRPYFLLVYKLLKGVNQLHQLIFSVLQI